MQRAFFSRLLLLGALLGLFATEAQAQYEARGSRSIGVAGGGPAYVRGTDAIFFNPANMTIRERPGNLLISLGGLSLFMGGDLFQFNHYTDSFTGGNVLTDTATVQLLDDWFGDKLRRANLFTDFEILSISYRQDNWAAGLGVRVRANSKIQLNRGFFDLLLRGTDTDRTVPVDFGFETLGMTEISFAFAYHFPAYRLHVGVAPKVVLGGFYNDGLFESDLMVPADETQPLVLTYDYTNRSAGNFSRDIIQGINLFTLDPFEDINLEFPFLTTDGFGYGADFGVTYEAIDDLYVSASITDLGFVKWTGDAQKLTPINNVFELEPIDFDKATDDFEEALDSLIRNNFEETNDVEEEFNAALPTSAHIGASWNLLKGRANVNGGVSFALNDQPGNIAQAPQIYVGGAYYLGPVPIRAGVRALGRGALTVAFGTGIRTRYFDFEIGGSGTPYSNVLGKGARFSVGFTALKFRI